MEICVLVVSAYLPLTLIAVFLGHFRINLHQTGTQYSNEGPQHWTQPKLEKELTVLGHLRQEFFLSISHPLRHPLVTPYSYPS